MDALAAAARAAGVEDERVLAAIASVPRSEFVPSERVALANVDTPIPIPREQVTTQPSLGGADGGGTRIRGRRARARRRHRLRLADGPACPVRTRGVQRRALRRPRADRPRPPRRMQERPRRGRRWERRPVEAGAALQRNHRRDHIPGGTRPARRPACRRRAARAAARARGAEDVVLFEKRGSKLHRVRSVSGAHFVRLYGRHGFP